MNEPYYVIAIVFWNNTEYWNSAFVNDDCSTKLIENAEWFGSVPEAEKELNISVKPYANERKWDVSFLIEEVS